MLLITIVHMENSQCNIPSKILKTIIAISTLGGKRWQSSTNIEYRDFPFHFFSINHFRIPTKPANEQHRKTGKNFPPTKTEETIEQEQITMLNRRVIPNSLYFCGILK